MKPGILAGCGMAEYLRLPALSASVLRTLVEECPRAAWHASWLNPHPAPADDTKASDVGSIAHAILLEGSTGCCAIIDPADYPAKNGNIPDGWTNGAIREARDDARAAGKIPILSTQIGPINAMVDAAQEYIESLKDSEPAIWAAFQPDGGSSEVTVVWEDGGTPCRLRGDRVSADRRLVIDAKFTGTCVEPDRWGRTQFQSMGYPLSAAFYRRGLKAVFDVSPDYVFLVVSIDAPYLCSLVGVSPPWLALAAEKVDYGLREWRRCVERGQFPAYPRRVAYPDLPPWEMARWQEMQGLDRDGIPYDMDDMHERKAA